MMNANEVRRVDLLAMLKIILKRWKTLLIVFLCCALVGVILNRKKAFVTVEKKIEVVKEVEEVPATVEPEVEEVLSSEDYVNATRDTLNKMIAHKWDYINNSKFKVISTEQAFVARAIYINVLSDNDTALSAEEGAEEEAENVADIESTHLADYLGSLKNIVFKYGDVANELGLKNNHYASELVSISAKGNTVVIDAVFDNEEGAVKLLDATITQVDNAIKESQFAFGETDFRLLNRGVEEMNNRNATWLTNQMTEVENLVKALTKLDENKETIVDAVDTELGIEEVVVEPEVVEPQVEKIKKLNTGFLFKKILIFGLAGTFGYALLLAILLLLKGTVLSGNEIAASYGLSPIASISKDGKDNDYSLAKGEIKTLRPSAKEVAIIGDVSEENLNSVYNNLQNGDGRSYKIITDLTNNSEARNSLANCDSAILVSKAQESSHTVINELLKYAKDRNVDVIGFIDLL